MENQKLGSQTYQPGQAPVIIGHGCVGGRKEQEGPLGRHLDHSSKDDLFGAKTWEQAESKMQQLALDAALKRAQLHTDNLDFLLAGDLLNQCIGSGYAARAISAPFLGLYGACSTMGESIAVGTMLLSGGAGKYAAAVTSSHFCSAERQYRTPLEYGCQRAPTAQWTATAAGAVILTSDNVWGIRIPRITIGKVVDYGIKDTANMGSAMAPAAYSTIKAHFEDTGLAPDYYDLIITGDLGKLGSEILADFFATDGCPLSNYSDCGLLLFDMNKQDVHAGASGCGCSASVLCTHLLPGLLNGQWKRVLFCPTGALHSPTSAMQGESVPGICHAIALEGVQ